MDALARFAERRRAVWLVAAWAFAEAVFLPVVPDVALDLFALAAPRRAAGLFLVATATSLAGSAYLFGLATALPFTAGTLVLAVPGIDWAMLDAARATVASADPTSIAQFGPGTPLKVFTVAWAIGPGSVVPFVVGVLLNRLTRIGPILVAAAVLGAVAPDWLRRHERPVLMAYGAAWIVLYLIYLGGSR